MGSAGGARYQRQSGHRGDAGQGFTAKSQGRHMLQVVERSNLAGRMPGQRQGDFGRIDAAAIVSDANRSAAAAFQLDLNSLGARVERILHQFFDHGSRALDDLAGSDLTDEGVGQELDEQWRPRVAHFRTSLRPKGARSIARCKVPDYSPAPPAAAAAVAITGRAGLPLASCAMRVPIGGLA